MVANIDLVHEFGLLVRSGIDFRHCSGNQEGCPIKRSKKQMHGRK
jgi:hypothetical protein